MAISRSLSLRESQTSSGNSEMSGSERDWKALPQGPLFLVSEQLQSEIDVVRFRSVCTSWRSAAPRHQRLWFLAHSRRLMDCGALFAFSGARIPDIPDIRLTRPYCSSYGWLADLYGGRRPEEEPITPGKPIILFNPITRDHIHLPVFIIPDSMDYVRIRLILSSNPATTTNYTGAILCDGKLGIYRSGEESWSVTLFPGFSERFTVSFYESDIAFYRGLIYVADLNRIFVFDPAAADDAKLVGAIPVPCVELDGKSSKCCRAGWNISCGCLGLASYLVESCGDLLLVRKDMRYLDDMTAEVLKLQLGGTSLGVMVKMESLGDRALFLDQGCSFSLSSTKFPEYKGNHIYYRSGRSNSIISMFNLAADGKEESATSELESWSHSLWFRPHLM